MAHAELNPNSAVWKSRSFPAQGHMPRLAQGHMPRTGTANHQEMTFDASVRRETVPSRITPNLEQKVKINPLKSRNYDEMAWTLWKPVWK